MATPPATFDGPCSSSSISSGVNNDDDSAVAVVNRCEQVLNGNNEILMVNVRNGRDDDDGKFLRNESNDSDLASKDDGVDGDQRRVYETRGPEESAIGDERQLSSEIIDQEANDCPQTKNQAGKVINLEHCLQNLSMCKASGSSTVELSGQKNVKIKEPKNRSVMSGQSSSVCSIAKKNTCSVQSETIPSKNTKGNKTKFHELSLLTVDKPYFTLFGDYNPEKDVFGPTKKTSNLEIPKWTVKPIKSNKSKKGTEDMSDDIFIKRHVKFEAKERKLIKWDMKQKAEARRNELLKEKLNKRHSKNAKEYNTKKEFTSFFPKQDTVKAIEITDKIPVFAFGENIYVKKNSPSEKPYCSKWCHNDPSRLEKEYKE